MSATSQKQEVITSQQTKILVKNMMRISISSICFHRDCFPPECFSFRNYGNMKVIQLDAAELDANENLIVKDEKAFLLTQWLEKGVFKALEDDLLTALSLAIYTEHPLTKEDLLLETYEFRFSFSASQATINGVLISTKDDIKTQAAKFVRNLISFTQTLDDLPEINWITMQMKYKSDTPSDYEPEYFTATDRSSLVFPDIGCLRVKLGSLETPSMKADAKFVGLESLLHDDLCKIKLSTKNLPLRPNSPPRKQLEEITKNMAATNLLDAFSSQSVIEKKNGKDKENIIEKQPKNVIAIVKSHCPDSGSTDEDESVENIQPNSKVRRSKAKTKGSSFVEEIDSDDEFERVKQYIENNHRVTPTDLAYTLSLSKDRVNDILARLLKEAAVERKNRYYVAVSIPASSTNSDNPSSIAKSITMKPTRCRNSSNSSNSSTQNLDEIRKNIDKRSKNKGIHQSKEVSSVMVTLDLIAQSATEPTKRKAAAAKRSRREQGDQEPEEEKEEPSENQSTGGGAIKKSKIGGLEKVTNISKNRECDQEATPSPDETQIDFEQDIVHQNISESVTKGHNSKLGNQRTFNSKTDKSRNKDKINNLHEGNDSPALKPLIDTRTVPVYSNSSSKTTSVNKTDASIVPVLTNVVANVPLLVDRAVTSSKSNSKEFNLSQVADSYQVDSICSQLSEQPTDSHPAKFGVVKNPIEIIRNWSKSKVPIN